jgi:hypothetical protein
VILQGAVAVVRKREATISGLIKKYNGLVDTHAKFQTDTETEKKAAEGQLQELREKLDQVTDRHRKVECENLALKKTLDEHARVPFSFSLSALGFSKWHANVFFEEQGQLKSRLLQRHDVIVTIQRHVPRVFEITTLFLKSPADSSELEIELPRHHTIANDPTTFPVTDEILQAITHSDRLQLQSLRLERLQSVSTTVRIALGYAMESGSGRTEPQVYRIRTEVKGEFLTIQISRSIA